MENNRTSDVQLILESIELELRRLKLWQIQRPEPSAYRSGLPFCHDTMNFSQWLQFVLIERIQELILLGRFLPEECSIAPYAEEALKEVDVNTEGLIALIRHFDSFLSNSKG